MKINKKEFDVILFDIGGVLVKLKGFSTVLEWCSGPIENEAEFQTSWFASKPMDDYHKGIIATSDYAKAMIKEFKLAVNEEVFVQEYAKYPIGLFDGVQEVLVSLAEKYTVACFSNNTEMHWDIIGNKLGTRELFQRLFLSQEMGMIKPDREAFEHVLKELNISPERILFYDDNDKNIEVACEVGFTAVKVKGFEDVKTSLVNLGIIEI